MRYLLDANTTERRLVQKVVERVPGERAVYGGCPVKAFEAFDRLVQAHQQGALYGVVGLVLTEDIVAYYSPELRAVMGKLLAVAGPPTVADDLSREWALHFGFRSVKGTFLAWAATEEDARDVLGPLADEPVLISRADVGIAVAAAILDIPCVLLASQTWGSEYNRHYVPLLRWANDSGVNYNVVWTEEDAQERLTGERICPVVKVPRDLVALRREQALAMLSTPEPDAVEQALGVQAKPRAARVLEVGSMFEPRTHYSEEYYGGADGIRFCMPDGVWQNYHATGHAWGGFSRVASWLRELIYQDKECIPETSLLDLGCGSGDFVACSCDVGFDGYGIDLSDAAIAQAVPEVRERVRAGDIVEGLGANRYDIITALDLWEHIAEPNLDNTIEVVRDHLKLGGLGFFNICTRGEGEADWTLVPPCEVTLENGWLLVAGHLTIRTWGWWVERFEKHGLFLLGDMCQRFQVKRCEDPSMKGADSWSPRNLIIVEKR